MRHLTKIFLGAGLAFALAGCSASTKVVGTTTLPTSGKIIDTVQHRSDSHGCAELVVLQTFDSSGQLIDSQQGRARSLPCTLVEVGIESGSRVGSAAIIARGMVGAAKATRPDNVDISNSNLQAQGQAQSQGQSQGQYSTNKNNNVWRGGNVHSGGGEGGGGDGGHGNNGNGNGSGDGSNPGTGPHHDNGDNN